MMCRSGSSDCWSATTPRTPSNRCRALQQFFEWLVAEDEIPDPMAGLSPPRVPDQPVPVFNDDDLASPARR
jgi:site-specific recombinase XerC